MNRIYKLLSDLLKEPKTDKWSLTRITFFISFIMLMAKAWTLPDLPINWIGFVLGLHGISKTASWGYDLNHKQYRKDDNTNVDPEEKF